MPCCVMQGPLFHTVPDFWRMVYESGSQMIVMLTRTEEVNVAGEVAPHCFCESTQTALLACWSLPER